ncbi:MAG: 4Fe-4S binding protein [Sutterella sp.]|nr:4Fe-4S binding protein [Sutterella sp.]
MEERLQFDRTRCVNLRHAAVNCRRCETVCARSVFKWENQALLLRPERCTQCGACLAECPTEALKGEGVEVPLLSQDEHEPTAHLTLACQETVHQTGEWTIPCLATLTLPDLLHLNIAGVSTLTLRHAPCDGCPKASYRSLSETIQRVEGLCAMLGGTLTVTQETRDAKVEHRRRAFLLHPLLSHRGAEPLEASSEPREPIRGEADTWVNPLHPPREPCIPDRQKQLFTALWRLSRGEAPLKERPLDWLRAPQWREGCDECGLCALVCPTGSLKGDPNAFLVLPMACVQCEACVRVCPHQSVELVPYTLAQFLSSTPLLVRVKHSDSPQHEGSEAWEQKLGSFFEGVPVYRT